MREGLPNALCEAMLCGCIAVGSDVQGVRTAMGEHGFLVPYGDVAATCDAIRKALAADDLGVRDWIASNFSEESRKIKLNALLKRLSARH
jgi:glycosyltransferase involved in cell wall biosynthesis